MALMAGNTELQHYMCHTVTAIENTIIKIFIAFDEPNREWRSSANKRHHLSPETHSEDD